MSLFKFLISDYSPSSIAKSTLNNNTNNLVETAKNVRRITIEDEPVEDATLPSDDSVDSYLEQLKQPTHVRSILSLYLF
jgi:hypothetical protein